MHLHILPTMNPDGFALRRRGNANNIDLNRDFPDQVGTLFCFPAFPYERFPLYLTLLVSIQLT
jgi:hypothetical protein